MLDPLAVTPPALVVGLGATGRLDVHSPYDGGFGIVSDNCQGIAVAVPDDAGVNVSPLATGVCYLRLVSGPVSARVRVEVKQAPGPAGLAARLGAGIPLTLNPQNLILANGAQLLVRIAQGSYAGPFSFGRNCTGIASFVPAPGGVLVTGVEAGDCSVTVWGLGGRSATLRLSVAPSSRVKP